MTPTVTQRPAPPDARIEALAAEVASLRRDLFLAWQVIDQQLCPAPAAVPARTRPAHLRLVASGGAR